MATKKRPVITILDARPMAEVSFNCSNRDQNKRNESLLCQIQLQNTTSGTSLVPPPTLAKPPHRYLNSSASCDQICALQEVSTFSDTDKTILKKRPVPASRKFIPSVTNGVIHTSISKSDESQTENGSKVFCDLSASQESSKHRNQNDETDASNVNKDSISFSEARARFGGNWLNDKELTKGNNVPTSVHKNRATVIRPKKTFVAKTAPTLDQCKFVSQAPKSIQEPMQNINLTFFKNNQQSCTTNVDSQSKPSVPRKPTIIRPKPLSRSVMLPEKVLDVDSFSDNYKASANSDKQTGRSVKYIRSEFDSTPHEEQTVKEIPDRNLPPDGEAKIISAALPWVELTNAASDVGENTLTSELDSVFSSSRFIIGNDILQATKQEKNVDLQVDSSAKPPRPAAGPKRGGLSEVSDTISSPQGPRAIALFDYNSEHPEDICFKVDEIILLDSWMDETWLRGRRWPDEKEGTFPSNFVSIIESLPTLAELNLDHNSSKNATQKTMCIARYDFDGIKENGELKFKKGDSIALIKRVNDEWLEGECNIEGLAEKGIFPSTFVDVIQDLTEGDHVNACKEEEKKEGVMKVATALHDFDGGQDGDLTFKAGDIIEVLAEINAEWMEGRIANRSGIFPSSFVVVE